MTQDNFPLSVVILAAGKGKRMNNPDLAKVMALLSGKPLISYVLDQVEILSPDKVILVVGHQKQSIIDFVAAKYPVVEFAEQNEQLGTGHAVDQTSGYFNEFRSDVLILAGDVPLLKEATLNKFIRNHKESGASVSVLSTLAPEPKGYGRIIRNADGDFLKITEEKDASPDEKLVNEINSGIFLVSSDLLFPALKGLSNNNAQGEYYLTDIIAILKAKGEKVVAFAGADFDELQGVNSPEDLRRAEEALLKF